MGAVHGRLMFAAVRDSVEVDSIYRQPAAFRSSSAARWGAARFDRRLVRSRIACCCCWRTARYRRLATDRLVWWRTARLPVPPSMQSAEWRRTSIGTERRIGGRRSSVDPSGRAENLVAAGLLVSRRDAQQAGDPPLDQYLTLVYRPPAADTFGKVCEIVKLKCRQCYRGD